MTFALMERPVKFTWYRGAGRRTLDILLAVPLALISVADGGRLQRRVLSRPVRATRFRGLLGIPFYLPAALITAYSWALIALNIGYPLRWLIGMGGSTENAWGGPTLIGAWAFHAIFGGVTFLLATPWILRGLTAVQARILGR